MVLLEQDTNQELLFDRVSEVVGRFADNPQTMWGIVVESLPVEIEGSSSHNSTLVSGALSVDYAIGSPYISTAAIAMFGTRKQFGGPFEKPAHLLGSDWHESDFVIVPSLGCFKSISEINGSPKDGAVRSEITERIRGDRRRLTRVANESLVQTLKAQGLPRPARLAYMYHRLIDTKPKWSETEATKDQHRKNIEAIKALITYAGVGRIAISSSVPVELHRLDVSPEFIADDEVEIDQEFIFEPHSKGFDIQNSPVGYSIREIISLSADSVLPIYEQEQGEMDFARKKTIGFDDQLSIVLDGLERSHGILLSTPEVYGMEASGIHRNVPLVQQHSRRILSYLKSI